MSIVSDWISRNFDRTSDVTATPAMPPPEAPPATSPVTGLRAAVASVAAGMSAADVDAWVAALAAPMVSSGITTPRRIAAFLGQVAVETGGLASLSENLNYQAGRLVEVWPSHFTEATAVEYAHNPERIANRAYADRMGNGNEASGDGWRFRGGGALQTTGRANYTVLATAMKMTPQACADWVRTKVGAAISACWYWSSKGCNTNADLWGISAISLKINGGTNGLADRINASNKALAAIGGS